VSIASATLLLDFYGIEVEIVADSESVKMLLGNYSFFSTHGRNPVLKYGVTRNGEGGFEILRSTGSALQASDDGDFLFQMEKEITIEIQKHRSDLYFLHAAVLEYHGLGLMLVANSGGGKSTTTWALCHHGFRYLSDELAPTNLRTLEVLPYSHALSLKRHPPSPYRLPNDIIQTSRTLHIPVAALPGKCSGDPTRLGVLFFISYRPECDLPRAIPISRAEAATRLFGNALNPLAHPGEGLDGVLEIASRCSAFELVTNDLPQTCALVKQTVESVEGSRAR